MSQPLVSVIIPVFNAEEHLPAAVESVRRQYGPEVELELILIDDGSTDGSAALIDTLVNSGQPPAIKISQSNQGPAAARNRGLEQASGEWIAFIDADDRWADHRLPRQLQRMTQEADLDLLVGVTQQVREDEAGELVPTGVPWMLFHLGAALFRRRAFENVGGFDESLRQGEDMDWFNRAREAGLNIGISKDLAQYYLRHDSNLTRDEQQRDHYFLAAMKKSLDRRRAKGGQAGDMPEPEELSEFKLPDTQ